MYKEFTVQECWINSAMQSQRGKTNEQTPPHPLLRYKYAEQTLQCRPCADKQTNRRLPLLLFAPPGVASCILHVFSGETLPLNEFSGPPWTKCGTEANQNGGWTCYIISEEKLLHLLHLLHLLLHSKFGPERKLFIIFCIGSWATTAMLNSLQLRWWNLHSQLSLSPPALLNYRYKNWILKSIEVHHRNAPQGCLRTWVRSVIQ